MRRAGLHVGEEEEDDDVAWESRVETRRSGGPDQSSDWTDWRTGLQTPETARDGNGKWQPVVSVAS